MPLSNRWPLRAALIALLTTGLVACGGGGGDDDDDELVVEDEDATGLWIGTYTQAGVPRTFGVIVAPNGTFVGAIANTNNNGRLLVGTGSTTQDILNAAGTVFAGSGQTLASGQTSAAFTIAAGRVTERVSMSGSLSGGGEAGSFSLSYDTNTARGASLTALAGTYSLYPPPAAGGTNASLVIRTDGTATYTTASGNTACNGNATFAVINASLNMYSWTLTVAACASTPEYTVSGLAAIGNVNGGSGNLLTMLGATAARDRGFVFIGSK